MDVCVSLGFTAWGGAGYGGALRQLLGDLESVQRYRDTNDAAYTYINTSYCSIYARRSGVLVKGITDIYQCRVHTLSEYDACDFRLFVCLFTSGMGSSYRTSVYCHMSPLDS